MKKSTIIFILLGLILGYLPLSSSAQETNASFIESNSLLWKIEGKGIKPSYLFGTIHIFPEKDFQISEKVAQAFKASEQIILEIDMSNPTAIALAMFQHAPMKDDMTLDKLMSKEDYEALNTHVQKTQGVSLGMVKNWQPNLLMAFVMDKLMEGPFASFEGTFVQMAQEQDKKILGLETVAEQCSFFDDISYEEQAKDLLKAFHADEEMIALYAKMIEAYKQESVNEIYNVVAEEYDQEEELNSLLFKRNHTWIPKIEELTQEKTSFIGVGAGHLGGEQGVINLLRKAGFTVSPVE